MRTRQEVRRRTLALAVLLALAGALLPSAALAVPVTEHPGEPGSIVVQEEDGLVPTVRWRGETRYDTAHLIAADDTSFRAPFETDTVLIATGLSFPDALAGSYLAGLTASPVLLTEHDRLSDATRTALDTLMPDNAILLGGTAALSEAVADALEEDYPDIDVRRVSGADRFATAARIGSEDAPTGDETRTAIVASGADYPDALSAGMLAVSEGFPLLLTMSDQLPPATRDALEDLGIDEVLLAGGTAAVSDAVVSAIEALGITVRRVGGATRSGTAAAWARLAIEEFGYRTDHFQLATGANFPDALAVAPHAGLERAALLLLNAGGEIDPELQAYLDELQAAGETTAMHVAGGTVPVPEEVVDEIRTTVSVGPATVEAAITGSTELLVNEPVELEVQVWDAREEPVADETVTVSAMPASETSTAMPTPESLTVLTDESGTAMVGADDGLTSTSPGELAIVACVDGAYGPQCAETLTVTFTTTPPIAGTTGLQNPRGLMLAGDRLWVAENGSGGDTCTPAESPLPVCYGESGAVRAYELTEGGAELDLTATIAGLPSLSTPEGASGPTDVAAGPDGAALVSIGLAAPSSLRDQVADDLDEPGIANLGSLAVVPTDGDAWGDPVYLDLAAYEEANNPDGSPDPADPPAEDDPFMGLADSNAYSVAWDEARGRALVTDAGGNTLLSIDLHTLETSEDDVIEVLAVFPGGESSEAPDAGPAPQAVPTSVTVGPDGAYYVTDLMARVWRIDPEDLPAEDPDLGYPLADEELHVFATGIASAIDLAFGETSLWVLDIFRGAIDMVPLSTDEGSGDLVAGDAMPMTTTGLTFPTGLTAGPMDDGASLYVSNCGISAMCGPEGGQLVRVDVPTAP